MAVCENISAIIYINNSAYSRRRHYKKVIVIANFKKVDLEEYQHYC